MRKPSTTSRATNSIPPSCESAAGSRRSGRGRFLVRGSFIEDAGRWEPRKLPEGAAPLNGPKPSATGNRRRAGCVVSRSKRCPRRGTEGRKCPEIRGFRRWHGCCSPISRGTVIDGKAIMRHTTVSTLLALVALGPLHGAARSQEATETYGSGYVEQDAYAVEDSLEARVWLDRGAEPVVEPGDEVRVYYRTSHDAFAAIFRIDTDGRISLVYPQHPDMDPWVVGGRDYRLLFADSPR
ncbi:MAG TPA: DUF4384 domain-containing protein, partial [Alphaproteobacteria bacterium]|nr:DUF4384 domain-containing protein [Alphaproteobacteria bacterium]